MPLRTCRVAIANEKSSEKIDGEAMKMCASGGDPQTARQNNQNESTFKLQCSFWLFCNDPPNFVGLDDAGVERLRIFTTAYKYLLPDKYDAYGDTVPDFVKRADPTLKSEWLKRKDVQQQLVINVLTSTPSNRDVRVHDYTDGRLPLYLRP